VPPPSVSTHHEWHHHHQPMARRADHHHQWTAMRAHLFLPSFPVLFTPPPIPTGLRDSSRIPTGFQQFFQKRYFHIFFPYGLLLDSYWTPTGLPLDSYWTWTKYQKVNTLLDTGFLLDSYWTPTGLLLDCYWIATEISYNLLLKMPRAKFRSCGW